MADALGHRPCDYHTAVGDLDVNGDFVLLGAEGSGGQASVVDVFDAGDGGFDERSFAVTVPPLPGHSTVAGDPGGMAFALTAAVRLALVGHRRFARWDDNFGW